MELKNVDIKVGFSNLLRGIKVTPLQFWRYKPSVYSEPSASNYYIPGESTP
jgi:hypothetical protein